MKSQDKEDWRRDCAELKKLMVSLKNSNEWDARKVVELKTSMLLDDAAALLPHLDVVAAEAFSNHALQLMLDFETFDPTRQGVRQEIEVLKKVHPVTEDPLMFIGGQAKIQEALRNSRGVSKVSNAYRHSAFDFEFKRLTDLARRKMISETHR